MRCEVYILLDDAMLQPSARLPLPLPLPVPLCNCASGLDASGSPESSIDLLRSVSGLPNNQTHQISSSNRHGCIDARVDLKEMTDYKHCKC